MQTIHNHQTGKTYTGEPVDCAEIMAMNASWKVQPPEPGNPDAPTQHDLQTALRALPAQIESGHWADAEAAVTSLREQFGELFTDEVELGVLALFPAATGTGRRSAKVGK